MAQVCWGPLSFYVAYLIATRSPLRFPLQGLVSLGQIYGDVLYYATSMFDLYHRNRVYCRPEPYYFWFYFFFMNLIWIVIPCCRSSSNISVSIETNSQAVLLAQSITTTTKAFRALDRMSKSLSANGSVPKPRANGQAKKNA